MWLTFLAVMGSVLMTKAGLDVEISGVSSEINAAVEDPSPASLPGLLYPRESESREVFFQIYSEILEPF